MSRAAYTVGGIDIDDKGISMALARSMLSWKIKVWVSSRVRNQRASDRRLIIGILVRSPCCRFFGFDSRVRDLSLFNE